MDLFTELYAKRNRIQMPEDDPIGICAWAAESGIPLEVAFALATSVLVGVVGPQLSVNVQVPGPAHSGLNLVARQGDFPIEFAAGQLTQGLFDRQAGLRDKSGDLTVDKLYQARHEGYKPRNGEDLQQVESRVAAGGDSTREPLHQLGADLRRIGEGYRMEALLHPNFVIGGSLGRKLTDHLADCHSGFGYYCGNPGPLPSQESQRDKQVDELLRCLLGTTVKGGHVKYQTPVDSRDLLLRGIFPYSEQDLEYLIEKRRDFLANTLLISSGPGAGESPDFDPETRSDTADAFLTRFHRLTDHCLASRRAGVSRMQGFFTAPAQIEFGRQQREFLRELSQSDSSGLSLQAARLPALLVWAISLLGSEYGEDDYILATAVPVARRLTAAGLLPFRLADHRVFLEERQRLAGKLMDRLRQLQPCTARTLVRGFDRQRMDAFNPLLETLILHGIMDQDPDKRLRLGRIPLSGLDVQNLLPSTSR